MLTNRGITDNRDKIKQHLLKNTELIGSGFKFGYARLEPYIT